MLEKHIPKLYMAIPIDSRTLDKDFIKKMERGEFIIRNDTEVSNHPVGSNSLGTNSLSSTASSPKCVYDVNVSVDPDINIKPATPSGVLYLKKYLETQLDPKEK